MKADPSYLKPYLRQHPLIGRIVCVVSLVVLPFAYAYTVLKEQLPDLISEYKEAVKLAFLPWEEHK